MYIEIEELVGKTLKFIKLDKDAVLFITENDEFYMLFHVQECGESVELEDVCGNLQDLVGSPIMDAEEVIDKRRVNEECDETDTWSFYKFKTVKGSVTLRWLGQSDGYCSEFVYFAKVDPEKLFYCRGPDWVCKEIRYFLN